MHLYIHKYFRYLKFCEFNIGFLNYLVFWPNKSRSEVMKNLHIWSWKVRKSHDFWFWKSRGHPVFYMSGGSATDIYCYRVNVYFFSWSNWNFFFRRFGPLGIRIYNTNFVRLFVCLFVCVCVRVHGHTKRECVYAKVIGRFLQIVEYKFV